MLPNILFMLTVLLLPPQAMGDKENNKTQLMSNQRLNLLINKVGTKIQKPRPGFWVFTSEGRKVFVITDEKANRMRIMTLVRNVNKLKSKDIYRMMQANFDSALDARYAFANGKLWSTFIHPLSPLTDQEFYSGLMQVVTLADNYGTSFTSGGLTFSGGDSNAINRNRQKKIRRREQSI